MDRAVIYTQETLRSYDYLKDSRRTLMALAWLSQDLLGSTSTFVAGFVATQHSPTSLVVLLAAGRIYSQAEVDASAFGALPADTTDIVTQQGWAAAQSVTLTTSGLTSGQSQWALIEASFSQADGIDSDDPTNGVLNFYNVANPQIPLNGPGGDGDPLNTDRQALAVITVVYGTAASTGSEVPPNPSSGAVPLYLIDLAFGQTQITNAEILVAGPNAGNNVPNNYPVAPFITGLSALGNPRVRLTANTNFYVRQSGSNNNTGLSTKSPWQTLQFAWNYLISNVDLAGFTATINVLSNITAGLVAVSMPIGGGSVIIDGGGFALVATNSSCGVAFNGAQVTFQNFSGTTATGSGIGQGTILAAANQGTINVGANMTIGIGTQVDCDASFGGSIFFNNAYTVAAGAHAIHWRFREGGQIYANGIAITLNSTPSCTTAWANGENCGIGFLSALTFTGAGTGLTALLEMLSVVDTGGPLNLPGNGMYTLNSGSQKR